jgi:hypothetical protein
MNVATGSAAPERIDPHRYYRLCSATAFASNAVRWALLLKGIMMDNKLWAASLGLVFGLLGIVGIPGVAQASPMGGPAALIGQSDSPLWTQAQAKKKATPARRNQRPRQPQQPAPQPGGGGGFLPG